MRRLTDSAHKVAYNVVSRFSASRKPSDRGVPANLGDLEVVAVATPGQSSLLGPPPNVDVSFEQSLNSVQVWPNRNDHRRRIEVFTEYRKLLILFCSGADTLNAKCTRTRRRTSRRTRLRIRNQPARIRLERNRSTKWSIIKDKKDEIMLDTGNTVNTAHLAFSGPGGAPITERETSLLSQLDQGSFRT